MTDDFEALFLGNTFEDDNGVTRRANDFAVLADGTYVDLCGDYSGVTLGGVPGYCSLPAGHFEVLGTDHRHDNGGKVTWGRTCPVIEDFDLTENGAMVVRGLPPKLVPREEG